MNSDKTVIIGMSGGVDSSVAAYLLKEDGYNVIGVTLEIWQDDMVLPEGGCGALSAISDAKAVADHLGIPHVVIDARADFRETVIKYFTDEYLTGRTPNPCVFCNRFMKWEYLLHNSAGIKADYIATGHYARIDKLPNGRFAIKNSVTASKDQTYALYRLTQEQLSKTLFPVGQYTKDEIREIAAKANLPVATKADSQDICFVPDGDYAGLIKRMKPNAVPLPGNFVNKDGVVLGRHKGIIHYTYGQRRGLEIAAGHRVFVTDIRPDTNEVVVGENEELFTTTVTCDDLSLMSIPSINKGEKIRVKAKIRYNHAGEFGYLSLLDNGDALIEFDKPVRAATPGQSCVIYDGDYVLGGGIIKL